MDMSQEPTPKEAAALLANQKGGKKKTKGTTIHISQFQSTWADDVPLPSGPSSNPASGSGSDRRDYGQSDRYNSGSERRGWGDRGDRDRDRDRDRDQDFGRRSDSDRNHDSQEGGWRRQGAEDREERRPLETYEKKGYQIDKNAKPPKTDFPTEPPFKAFLGNLPFSIREDEISALFEGCTIIQINMVKDRETGKPKGYAYVEFKELSDLQSALEMNGAIVQERSVRVDLAESRDKTSGDWRSRDEAPRRKFREAREGTDELVGEGGDRPRQPRSSKSDEVDDWRKRDETARPDEDRFSRPQNRDRFSNEEGSQNREGGFQNRGGYQNREGGYQNRDRGGYQNREGGYQNREGGYQNRDGGYQNREGGYQNREGGYQNRDRGYQPREGSYQPREGSYQPREGGYQNREGGYQNRDRSFPDQTSTEQSSGEQTARRKLELKPKSDGPKDDSKTENRPRKSDPFAGAKPRDESEIQKRQDEKKQESS